MKNLYSKSKGKIHPSPSSTAPNPRSEALATLRILPAAILALTATLCSDDKEVLAYLIIRSISGPEESAEQRRGEFHSRLFGCGCFDCYTTFWSRWDCSPDRELIHQAIEAFEDHLASSERIGSVSKAKRRDRKVGVSAADKGKKKCKDKNKIGDEISSLIGFDEEIEEETVVEGSEKGDRDELVEVGATEAAPEVSAGGDRRKGWADVTAIFNSRLLWSLWSPGD